MPALLNSMIIAFGMVGVPIVASLGIGPLRITSQGAWTTLLLVTVIIALVTNLIGSLAARKKSLRMKFRSWGVFWVLLLGAGWLMLEYREVFGPVRDFLRSLK